jgi:hypothetical protein
LLVGDEIVYGSFTDRESQRGFVATDQQFLIGRFGSSHRRLFVSIMQLLHETILHRVKDRANTFFQRGKMCANLGWLVEGISSNEN